jgi:hypothetical protein
MNNSTKQNINFLEVLPVRYDRMPNIYQIVLTWVLFSGLVYLLHLFSMNKHHGLIELEKKIKNDLDSTISFLEETHKNDESQVPVGKIVAISDQELKLDNVGFANNLIALAQYGSPEVWFTSLVFNHEKNEIKLTGLTVSTKTLNKFFSNLKNHESFKDKNLVLKDIRRNKSLEQDKGSTHSFVITGSFS